MRRGAVYAQCIRSDPVYASRLYPLDKAGGPLGATGGVVASQRGLNVAVPLCQSCTLRRRAVRAEPDGVERLLLRDGDVAVGGTWPETGYHMPTPKPGTDTASGVLDAGAEVTLSDAILVFRHDAPLNEREPTRRFLQMLGVVYKAIDPPQAEYRDASAIAYSRDVGTKWPF